MINTTVIGNLGKDAELREVGDSKVVNFSVASNSRAKVDGEWVDTTCWVRVSFWGARAASISQYLVKGKQVAVRGELTQKEYTNKDGELRTSLEVRADEITLLGSKAASNQSAETGSEIDF